MIDDEGEVGGGVDRGDKLVKLGEEGPDVEGQAQSPQRLQPRAHRRLGDDMRTIVVGAADHFGRGVSAGGEADAPEAAV